MPLKNAWLPALLAASASLALGACHDWETYDPRGPASASSSGSSSGSGSSASAGGGGSGGGGVCTAPVEDTFDGATVDVKRWLVVPTTDAQYRVEAEQLVITLSMAAHSAVTLTSIDDFALDGCRAFVKIVQIPDSKTTSLALFTVQRDDKNTAVFVVTHGSLQAKREVDGMTQEQMLTAKPFNPNSPFVGIRKEGSMLYWETSSDGKTWTEFYAAPDTLPSGKVNIKLGAVNYEAETMSPGEVRFSNVDVLH